MFAGAVEAPVEEADPLFQVEFFQSHHSVSHHLLLSNETLQLVALEGLQPAGGDDQVFGVSFEISCRGTHNYRGEQRIRSNSSGLFYLFIKNRFV